MNRGSLLIAVTPGSCLARRITYSQSSRRRANKRQPQVVGRMRCIAAEDAVNKTHVVPRMTNPEFSFAKRLTYSVNLRGKADPLSESMRDYVTNTSQLDTWLKQRIMKRVEDEVKQKRSFQVKFNECSSSMEPDSSVASKIVAEKPKLLKDTKKMDSLPQKTRNHFLKESKA